LFFTNWRANFLLAPSRPPCAEPTMKARPGCPLTTTELPVAIARERDEARVPAQALSVSPAATLAFNLSPMRANPFLTLDALLLTGRAQATLVKAPGVFCRRSEESWRTARVLV